MARFFLSFVLCFAFVSASSAHDYNPLTESEIDALVEKTLKAFNIPGISVSIIKDDKVIHSKGYGIKDIHTNEPVDANTLFQIASNTKAMTTAALAMLMDEGKLTWDDKVTKYLPEFQMFEPYVTREFTIRDLLTHRSGLPLGAGDLLFFPDSVGTLDDIFRAIKTIKPASSFRSKYDYDNLMYMLAGEIVTRVSGVTWADFVEDRIFAPLGLDNCKAIHPNVPKGANEATPHAMDNGKLKTVPYADNGQLGAAGGVNCSTEGLTKWLSTQLNHGKMPNGEQLFSTARHADMWTPVTIRRASLGQKIGSKVMMSHYALGWGISEVMGHQMISHTGGLDGMLTLTVLIPEKNLGFLVFTNQINGAAFSAIQYSLLEGFLGQKAPYSFDDFVKMSAAGSTAAVKAMKAAWDDRDTSKKASLPLGQYAQTYSDAWYGDVDVTLVNGKLRFISRKSPNLKGSIKHFEGDTFVVEWDDRSWVADAYMTFKIDQNNKISNIVMKKFDPRTDFSYDFWHLDLRPKN